MPVEMAGAAPSLHRFGPLVGAALVFSAVASAASAAEGVFFRIDNAAARVVVIPEARGDVVFDIRQGRKDLPLVQSRQDGGVLVVDGGLGSAFGPIHLFANLNCHGSGDRASVDILGHGRVPVAELPVVTVRTPMHARISAAGAIYGAVAPSETLELKTGGCGAWRVQEIKNTLQVGVAGSSDVHGAAAGDARVGVTGSGNVFLGAVRSLSAHVAGSGDVKVAAVRGPIEAEIAGSGDISVERGAAPMMTAAISGSGAIHFGGAAGDLKASIAGAGDIDVFKVEGRVSSHVAGSGAVKVGGR